MQVILLTWRRGAAYDLIREERKVREALRNPIEVLKSLTEQSKDETYRFQRLNKIAVRWLVEVTILF